MANPLKYGATEAALTSSFSFPQPVVRNSPDELSIYAELLPNLGRVSVVATLPSPADDTTVAEVSKDGSNVRIHHQGEWRDLLLPGTVVKPPSVLAMKRGVLSLSWRLQLPQNQVGQGEYAPESHAIPWSAADLLPGSAVSCRRCKAVIVPEDAVEVWKDLPAENWAEMMEFWHCHKPGDQDRQDDGDLAQRGYGANSTISGQDAIGLVDLSSFLFAESDCKNLKVSPNSNTWKYLFQALEYKEGGQAGDCRSQ